MIDDNPAADLSAIKVTDDDFEVNPFTEKEPASWKETLVFWRAGERRLPSSEAFTKIAPSDLRIDTSTLAHRVGTFPTDYRQQSALWYATYRKHANEMSVTDANSAYLLHREMASLSAMLVLVAPVTGKLLHAPASRILIAAGIIGLEYLLVMLAARNAGTRLVANVLAIESAAPLLGSPLDRSTR